MPSTISDSTTRARSYLLPGIILTLCGAPTGVGAIIYGILAERAYTYGNLTAGHRHATMAKWWCLVSVLIAAVSLATMLYVVFNGPSKYEPIQVILP